jgi:hypothetical protein
MPYISSEKRVFTICGTNYTIPETISFKNNCEIEFNQNQADTLYTHILNVIDILDKICPGEYWAIGGTLLGTIRCQQILPWDDDSDFAVTMKGYSLLVGTNMNGYEFIESAIGLKVFYGDLCVSDIFVCDYINKNKLVYSGPVIHGVSTFYTYKYIFNQIKFKDTDIFPLIRKQFGTKTIPCPKNYTRILINNYRPGVLTTIIPPTINNFHSLATKEFFIESYKYTKNYSKYGPETVKVLYTLVGYVMNQNMSNFVNLKPFSSANINYLDLSKEQIKPDFILNQIQLLLSIIPKN